mgnify:CR=1 FL=1
MNRKDLEKQEAKSIITLIGKRIFEIKNDSQNFKQMCVRISILKKIGVHNLCYYPDCKNDNSKPFMSFLKEIGCFEDYKKYESPEYKTGEINKNMQKKEQEYKIIIREIINDYKLSDDDFDIGYLDKLGI